MTTRSTAPKSGLNTGQFRGTLLAKAVERQCVWRLMCVCGTMSHCLPVQVCVSLFLSVCRPPCFCDRACLFCSLWVSWQVRDQRGAWCAGPRPAAAGHGVDELPPSTVSVWWSVEGSQVPSPLQNSASGYTNVSGHQHLSRLPPTDLWKCIRKSVYYRKQVQFWKALF